MNELYTQKISPLLSEHMTELELDFLLKHSQVHSYDPEEILLDQGEEVKAVYFILEGQVLVTAKIMHQGLTRLETLEAGSFLSPLGCTGEGLSTTSYKAITAVLCLIIPYHYFNWLSKEFMETKYKIYKMIANQNCERLKKTHEQVTSFISNSDMLSLPFFSQMIDSLNQPKKISLEPYKEILREVPLFSIFNPEELELIFKKLIILDAPKNCKLIAEGEKIATCYLVLYGAVQSCIIQNKKQAKLSVIGPERLLSSIGCIQPDLDLNISYITCEHSILCHFPESALLLIKEQHPKIWYQLFNFICGSLTELKKSMDKLNIRLQVEHYNR